MISVSDIIKLLEQIPIWKTLRDTPKKIQDLEARMAALETAASAQRALPKIPAAKACPMCGAEMKVTAERPHPSFAFAGVKLHDMACSCGHKTERLFDPSKGYTA